jgi:hypothetical protein
MLALAINPHVFRIVDLQLTEVGVINEADDGHQCISYGMPCRANGSAWSILPHSNYCRLGCALGTCFEMIGLGTVLS